MTYSYKYDETTTAGVPRGKISLHKLKELWIHTGSACNLACPFCFENCSPDSVRIDQITFEDVYPYIDQAVRLGVRRISFTGGEPFVNKHLIAILEYVLEHKPALILSNGTEPLLKSLGSLRKLKSKSSELIIRLSLDFPDADKHNANRGSGNFEKTVQALVALNEAGIKTAVARINHGGENLEAIRQDYSDLFLRHGLPEDLPLVELPGLDDICAEDKTPEISEGCIKTYYPTLDEQAGFMCNHSRMLLKQNGKMKIFACTLVDNDDFFDLGSDLQGAVKQDVVLKHHRCWVCFSCGVDCGGV